MEAWNYWNRQGIPTPFNGFLPKGEIGINTAYARGSSTVWSAQTCEHGLLHPVEQIEAELVPRLADLSMTAMRRDETGKAAGHQAVPEPGCPPAAGRAGTFVDQAARQPDPLT